MRWIAGLLALWLTGAPMAGETFDFNSGASLASLGWSNISGVTNAAGVGNGGTYAIQSADRFSEASKAITPGASATEICVTFWWNRTITNGEIYLLELRAGTFLNWWMDFYVMSGSTDGYIQSSAGLSTPVLTGLWDMTFPGYVRVYVKASEGGTFGLPASDGIVKVWTGPSTSSLTLKYSNTAAPIYDFTKNSQNAYGALHFAPQGVVDDITWSDTACEAIVDLIEVPQDYSTPDCCTSAPGTGSGGEGPDPTLPTQPNTFQCDGGGTVPTASDPTAGETWSD